MPHAEYLDIANAHHMVAGDQNDIFGDAVISFLFRRMNSNGSTAETNNKGTQ